MSAFQSVTLIFIVRSVVGTPITQARAGGLGVSCTRHFDELVGVRLGLPDRGQRDFCAKSQPKRMRRVPSATRAPLCVGPRLKGTENGQEPALVAQTCRHGREPNVVVVCLVLELVGKSAPNVVESQGGTSWSTH